MLVTLTKWQPGKSCLSTDDFRQSLTYDWLLRDSLKLQHSPCKATHDLLSKLMFQYPCGHRQKTQMDLPLQPTTEMLSPSILPCWAPIGLGIVSHPTGSNHLLPPHPPSLMAQCVEPKHCSRVFLCNILSI